MHGKRTRVIEQCDKIRMHALARCCPPVCSEHSAHTAPSLTATIQSIQVEMRVSGGDFDSTLAQQMFS